MNRGDVVIIDFPFTSGSQSKVRPALVVQCDRENQRLNKTIIAMITGNLKRSGEPTHSLIDITTQEGVLSGLRGPSLVSCINLYTVEQSAIVRTIGRLSASAMQRVDTSLKSALGIV
jgi:mRNA interferase MazF